jgi:hypothetical protein
VHAVLGYAFALSYGYVASKLPREEHFNPDTSAHSPAIHVDTINPPQHEIDLEPVDVRVLGGFY